MTTIQRATKETKIDLTLEVYGEGKSNIKTDIGFLNHMLESLTKHALLDLTLSCKGDIEVDFHHSTEDIGIVFGEALKKEIFPVKNIERFGEATVVMDESAVNCVIDVSNRPFLVFDLPINTKIGEFDSELIEEFFRALVINAGLSVHITFLRGKNTHHIAEAAFKSFAIALRRALCLNSRVKIPSTKGILWLNF